jgi:ribosome-binding protein aMBF1 (putative translation factor)
MECKICGNELETEGEEIEGVCEDCRPEYYRHGIFGPSVEEELSP